MLYISMILHELMHFIFAKVFKMPIIAVKIGADWPQIKVGKWRISPIIGNSYVEVDYDNLIKLSKGKISWFFMSGILMNFYLAIVFGILNINTGMLAYGIISVSNVVIAISNLLPCGRTDMANLIMYVK